MNSEITGSRVIVALDFPDAKKAWSLVEKLDPALCRVKVGKELFTRAGPDLVRRLGYAGFDVFLDLKFHDIPNTVARACQVAADLGVWMMNVHSLGGPAMLSAAREALEGRGEKRPLLIGVTILTSMDQAQLSAIGITDTPAAAVLRLAGLASEAGLDGVVCSALEAAELNRARGKDFLLVTPGIRPAGAAKDDQSRIATPASAIRDGAHYLVVGRPVTQADDPRSVLLNINSEISSV